MGNRFLQEDLISASDEVESIKRLSNREIADSHKELVSVCYTLADMGKTRYGFDQVFSHNDTKRYFEVMQKFATNTLESLFENRKHYHLFRSDVRGNLKSALLQIYPDFVLDPLPTIYHFALYTSTGDKADRDSDTRSPRIYFVLADCGRIYPIFFDPYHELNP